MQILVVGPKLVFSYTLAQSLIPFFGKYGELILMRPSPLATTDTDQSNLVPRAWYSSHDTYISGHLVSATPLIMTLYAYDHLIETMCCRMIRRWFARSGVSPRTLCDKSYARDRPRNVAPQSKALAVCPSSRTIPRTLALARQMSRAARIASSLTRSTPFAPSSRITSQARAMVSRRLHADARATELISLPSPRSPCTSSPRPVRPSGRSTAPSPPSRRPSSASSLSSTRLRRQT